MRLYQVTCVFLSIVGCGYRPALAFKPAGFTSVRQQRQWRLGNSPDQGLGLDAAGKALEQAAKLREEIADLELERDVATTKKPPIVGKPGSQNRKLEPAPRGETNVTQNRAALSPFSLAPTRWLIKMDIGREKGTWMPQAWGASGRRLMIDLSIQFLPGGEVVAKVASPFIVMTVKPGRWNFEPAGGDRRRTTKAAGSLNVISDTCRFWVETEGFSRGDVTIPPGKIFFALPSWGGQLSRKGALTVRHKRFFVLEESRMFGVFRAEIIDADADGRTKQS